MLLQLLSHIFIEKGFEFVMLVLKADKSVLQKIIHLKHFHYLTLSHILQEKIKE